MKKNLANIQIEEQFKIMADSAPVLIWISGLDKLCNYFNEGWFRFTGRTMEQEYGNGWAEGVHPDDYDRCLKTYVEAFERRIDFTMEYRLKRHDGKYRWVTNNGVPRYLDDGTFVGFIGTCIDVHKLLEDQRSNIEVINKKALLKEQDLNEQLASTNEELTSSNEGLLWANEELSFAKENLGVLNFGLEEIVSIRTNEILASELRYRNLVENAPVAIATLTGKEFIVTSANEMVLQVWGKTSAILGMRLEDALPELREQQFLQLLDEVFITSTPFYGNEERAMLEFEGELKEFYFDFIYKPLKGQNGNTESIIVIATDVTERVNSRKKVEHARNRMHNMVTTSPIGMTILQGRDFKVEIANEQMLSIWHRSKEQVIGKNLWDIFPEIKATEFPSILENVFENGKAFQIPEVHSPHLEKESYINISYDPLIDKSGKVESILVSVIDITEMVNGRKLLEQSQYDLQASIEELRTSNDKLTFSNCHLEKVRQELEESVAEVSANENKLLFMLNAIPQQVWTSDNTGALNYVNDVVCREFGYSTEVIVGKGWQEFIHPQDLSECLEKWSTAIATGQEYTVEFRLRFKDGNYYWHLVRALPLIEADGVTMWLGTNTNIQVQKHNNELKDEFLSIASHELKTPLTSIKALNQLMARSKNTEGNELFVRKSSEQINRLERLITDLLDVTKINAGKIRYNIESFNFMEMIASTIDNIRHTSPKHDIILLDGIDIEYKGDRFRLEQVVHNLLSNAIKYSPDGKRVIVKSKLMRGNIIVSIQDFGIGIAKENITKLFNRYFRIDNSSKRFDGLGLGLFISSEVLKRHQGNFWVESKEGEGSTFYFALPLNQITTQEIINRKDFYQDQSITVQYNHELKTIYSDWTGFQSVGTVKNSAMVVLEMAKKYGAKKVFNDNTNVIGTWSEASEWVGIEFFPMMEKVGITHFAWIYSLSGFSQLSARKSVDFMLGNITVKFFTETEEAEKWLQELKN